MPGTPVALGPFVKGMHNSAGIGEFIDNQELFLLSNLEVDTDGSLVNRPPISNWNITNASYKMSLIGVFTPDNDTDYLVVVYNDGSDDYVGLVNIKTNVIVSNTAIRSNTVVQYNNSLYVIPYPDSGQHGGSFSDANPPVWTEITDIPEGETAILYNERMFVGAGVNSTTNTTRMSFSAIGDFTSWDPADYFDINKGDGQKLSCLKVLGTDILIFKEHSTYRAGYSSDVRKMTVLNVSTYIGAANDDCAVVSSDNSVYTLHDSNVYELYNYSYSKISDRIRLTKVVDPDMDQSQIYGLSIFGDRLFLRYFDTIYVYNVLIRQWSLWETDKKFGRLLSISDENEIVAFANPALNTAPYGTLYSFTEDRLTGVGVEEIFNCKIITKTYDFDVGYAYKVLFWWAADVATSSDTYGALTLDNSSSNPTWADWASNSWQELTNANTPWSNEKTVIYSAITPANLGGYGKKILKFPKKIRFRKLSFTLSTEVSPNDIGDASVRIYSLTAFVKPKELIVKETT